MNKTITHGLLIVLLLITSFSAFRSYQLEKTNRILKSDLIELSDIKYGLFNVDVWKEQLATIITKKLKELKLTGEDKEKARIKIENFLTEAISKFEVSYKEENNKKSFFGISFKSVGADVFEIFEKLEDRVPQITEDILTFLENAENRENIKDYILAQLDTYRDGTFQKIDYSKYNEILANYNAATKAECQSTIKEQVAVIHSKSQSYNILLLLSFLLVLLLTLTAKTTTRVSVSIYVLTALIFLLLGVFLPMIDIDARIQSLEFKLMGENILFNDQVLYFKSKSIIEMSEIMLTQDEVKVMLVGVLVLLFSIIFPAAKLSSSLLLIFNQGLKENRIIKFLVFKSGKWSMADVMVVAIFMSYIGFSGIISSQLNQLQGISESLHILTTNNSVLQNGFYFFLGFVILSISISQLISGVVVKAKE